MREQKTCRAQGKDGHRDNWHVERKEDLVRKCMYLEVEGARPKVRLRKI